MEVDTILLWWCSFKYRPAMEIDQHVARHGVVAVQAFPNQGKPVYCTFSSHYCCTT